MPSPRQLITTAEDVDDLWDQASGLERSHYVVLFVLVATAAVLLIGGDARITSDAFSVTRATGGANVWGCAYAVLAVVQVVARTLSVRAVRNSLWLSGGVMALGAIGFADSAFHSHVASWLGAVNSVALVAFLMSHAESYRRRSP